MCLLENMNVGFKRIQIYFWYLHRDLNLSPDIFL